MFLKAFNHSRSSKELSAYVTLRNFLLGSRIFIKKYYEIIIFLYFEWITQTLRQEKGLKILKFIVT